jgi:predicted nucleic acid-binding protein
MPGKAFVDSNFLIYVHDGDAGTKQRQAAELVKGLWQSGLGRPSTHVLQEFYVNATEKIKRPLARGAARKLVRRYGLWLESQIGPETVIRASEIGENSKLPFWDSMIVAAAEQDGAEELLTEDLGHGQIIAGIRVGKPVLVAVFIL